MAVRRAPTERLLSGRNSANPIEMASDFNLSPSAPQSVGGVMSAARPQGTIGDSSLAALNGMAEWGTKKIREAAKTRYETLAMDGAMAYQQGKAVNELDMDGNKWMLEGYRVMEAETVASALFAAQQEEISLSMHESDPNAFRQRYTGRLQAAIAGKDERTQDLINKRMMEQMPQLVAQHTRENARYLEGQNYDALTSSVDIISRDPANASKLLDFANGTGGSEGLSSERRQAAVIDGIARAYANDNPLAFAVLDNAGALNNLTAAEQGTLRAAAASYESRTRSTYSEARFNQDRALLADIESGTLTPEEAVAKRSQQMVDQGLTMTVADADATFNIASSANASHLNAVGLEIETAKINGDFGKIADLSYQYASRAGVSSTPGTVYKHETNIQYSMGPKRPNKPGAEVVSVIGRAAEDTFGVGAKVVITSGQENEGQQHGANRHKTGNAADLTVYRPDGTKVKLGDPDMDEFAVAAASLGAKGIGYGEDYMGDGIHIDLVTPGKGQANVWKSGAKAVSGRITAAMASAGSAAPGVGKIDTQKWAAAVVANKGDIELAAVAYDQGQKVADEWVAVGRGTEFLSDKTATFVKRIGNSMSGERYVTGAVKQQMAAEIYKATAERNAIDVYAQIAPLFNKLGQDYVYGGISKEDYETATADARGQWNLAMTKADVDQTIALGNERAQLLLTQAADTAKANQETADKAAADAYKTKVDIFDVTRTNMDNKLTDAVDAITSLVKPNGISDADFTASQQQLIMLAQRQHQTGISDAAAAAGLEFKDSSAVATAKNGIATVRDAMNKALQNTEDNATMERAVEKGTLGLQTQAIQERAYKAALPRIQSETQKFAVTPNKKGKLPSQEEVAQHEAGAMEDWYAKSNYVPEKTQQEFSAALNGKLVGDNNVVSQHALDAIQAYSSLKDKSDVAANKLLDPQARMIADAALSIAGSPEALPRVLLDMWAEGLNSPFTGKPSPDFAERGDVQASIKSALGGGSIRRMLSNLIGKTPLQSLDTVDQSVLSSMMSSKIQSLHNLNPNLNPKYLTKIAEAAVLRSAVPVPNMQDTFFGGRENAGNTLLIDPTGNDVFEQTFGAKAPAYAKDRGSVSKAIDGYLASDAFKQKYGDLSPETGALSRIWQALPFTADTTRSAERAGVPQYTARHVGNGSVYFDFTLNSAGGMASKLIPLSEIGEWYTAQDEFGLTK